MDWVPLVAGVEAEPRVFRRALTVSRSRRSAAGCGRRGSSVVCACGQTRVQANDSPPMCVVSTKNSTRTFTQNGSRSFCPTQCSSGIKTTRLLWVVGTSRSLSCVRLVGGLGIGERYMFGKRSFVFLSLLHSVMCHRSTPY